MFQMVGFEKFDPQFVKQDEWYKKKTWTSAQEAEFKKFFIKTVKKYLAATESSAESEWAWFNLDFG